MSGTFRRLSAMTGTSPPLPLPPLFMHVLKPGGVQERERVRRTICSARGEPSGARPGKIGNMCRAGGEGAVRGSGVLKEIGCVCVEGALS